METDGFIYYNSGCVHVPSQTTPPTRNRGPKNVERPRRKRNPHDRTIRSTLQIADVVFNSITDFIQINPNTKFNTAEIAEFILDHDRDEVIDAVLKHIDEKIKRNIEKSAFKEEIRKSILNHVNDVKKNLSRRHSRLRDTDSEADDETEKFKFTMKHAILIAAIIVLIICWMVNFAFTVYNGSMMDTNDFEEETIFPKPSNNDDDMNCYIDKYGKEICTPTYD